MTDRMTDPTTPRPTDAAIALDKAWRELEADALASDGPIRDRDVREAIKRNRARIEAAALATIDPRVIAIGQAWVAAEAALPEGWCVGIESDADIDGTDYVTFAGPNAQPRRGKYATSDTPEAALLALAAALTDQERSHD